MSVANPRAIVLEQDDGTWTVEPSGKYPARARRRTEAMATIEEKLRPKTFAEPAQKPLAAKQDVDNLYDLFRKLEARVDDVIESNLRHESQLDHLKDTLGVLGKRMDDFKSNLLKRLYGAKPEVEADPYESVKAEILDLFKALPAEWEMPKGTIIANLKVPTDKVAIYRNQIKLLAERGDLLPDRETAGVRGGAYVNYRLASHPEAKKEAE